MNKDVYRGKVKSNGRWVYGGRCEVAPEPQAIGKSTEESKVYIFCENPNTITDWGMSRQMCLVEVMPETVGQRIGIADKHGKLIHEDDVIETHTGFNGVVKFGSYFDDEALVEAYGWYWYGFIENSERRVLGLTPDWSGHSIIGNIHDDKELRKIGE